MYTHNLCFEPKIKKKYHKLSAENFHYLLPIKSLIIAW